MSFSVSYSNKVTTKCSNAFVKLPPQIVIVVHMVKCRSRLKTPQVGRGRQRGNEVNDTTDVLKSNILIYKCTFLLFEKL
eukprot:scaffold912_cov187-Ochromonas_danica.AAC.39